MLVKTMGIIILLCGSLYLCVSFSLFERRRLEQCEGFLLLIRHVKAQIACFHMPLSRIWQTFSSRELERCGFLSALRESGDFEAALDACRGRIWLSEDELGLLRAFAGELGRSYLEEQMACCDYYIGELERAYAQRRTARPARTRLFRSLFLTGGLMLVILLL